MIKRPTWILVALFAVSVVGLLLWQRFKPDETASEALPTQAPKLFDFDASVITRLELKDATQTVFYIKQPDGNWYFSTDTMTVADSTEIMNRLATLMSVRVLNVLKTPPGDDLTGLSQPVLTLMMTLEDGKTYQLVVGSPTATGSGYYTRAGGSQVLVVNKSTVDQILGLKTAPPLLTPEASTAPAGNEGTPVP